MNSNSTSSLSRHCIICIECSEDILSRDNFKIHFKRPLPREICLGKRKSLLNFSAIRWNAIQVQRGEERRKCGPLLITVQHRRFAKKSSQKRILSDLSLDQIQSFLNKLKVKRRALLSVSMIVETWNMSTRKKKIELKFDVR